MPRDGLRPAMQPLRRHKRHERQALAVARVAGRHEILVWVAGAASAGVQSRERFKPALDDGWQPCGAKTAECYVTSLAAAFDTRALFDTRAPSSSRRCRIYPALIPASIPALIPAFIPEPRLPVPIRARVSLQDGFHRECQSGPHADACRQATAGTSVYAS
jgi:hypothetical protein